IRQVLAEEVTHEQLGGAVIHGTTSGVAHFVTETEQECFLLIRKLLSFLPSNNLEEPPRTEVSGWPPEENPVLDD
ncbi:MAG: methylmalonyl-CoA carboxyltransferase, partial [Akkermansiaceae bacterium]|nr:methylmalonyl-CoA carboxyltransferase [Akkermansiaceae bacterium]